MQHKDITESLDLNDPNLVKAIWKPEVYFPNAKHAEFQFVTVPNVLIRIKPDGDILYMLRYFFFLFITTLSILNHFTHFRTHFIGKKNQFKSITKTFQDKI